MAKEKNSYGAGQKITVVRATRNDSTDIWEWRNDELTTQMSLTPGGVSWEAHTNWYEKSLITPSRHIYIGHLPSGKKIGVCRFDVAAERNTAEVSINLNPQYRGKGLSSQLLSVAISRFWKNSSMELLATVKKENIGSIKCFETAGFTFEREDGECMYYRKQPSKL